MIVLCFSWSITVCSICVQKRFLWNSSAVKLFFSMYIKNTHYAEAENMH